MQQRYYFITYQAKNKQGCISIWNQVTNKSPMKFIQDVEAREEEYNNPSYRDYVVLNTCEISEDEFKEYDGWF